MTVSDPETFGASNVSSCRVPKPSVIVRRAPLGASPAPTPQPAATKVAASSAARTAVVRVLADTEHDAVATALQRAVDVAGAVGHLHVEHPAARAQPGGQQVRPVLPVAGGEPAAVSCAAVLGPDEPLARPVVGRAVAPAVAPRQAQADLPQAGRVGRRG